METLAFILHNLPAIGERTLEHLSIVSVAVGIAIVTGVPLGIAITQSQRAADTVLYLGSIVMTIPSIALFGVLIPILSKIGHGIGGLGVAAGEEHFPRRGCDQPVDHPQRRRLTAARRSQQHAGLALAHFQTHAIDRRHHPLRRCVGLGQRLEPDHGQPARGARPFGVVRFCSHSSE